MVAVCVAAFETERIAARTSGGYGTVVGRDYLNAVADVDHRDIDAIHRRAADEARDPHYRFSSRCSSFSNCSASIGRSSSTFKLRMRSAI